MQRERHNAYKLIFIQAVIVIVLSLAFLFFSFEAAYSVFLGGMCCVLPSIYFAHKLFKYLGGTMLKKMLTAFYVGELVKLILIGCLSMLVFKFVPINPLNYFAGFIVAQFAFWIAPNILVAKQTKINRGVL